MSTAKTINTRLLLCSSSKEKLRPLQQRFNAAGVVADCATTAENARQLLWDRNYDGVVVDLLMADRDGISFAMELRQEHPWMSILVVSSTRNAAHPESGPEWLAHSTEHARLIFALKQAGQRSAGRAPRILHVESNDMFAELVKNTIGKQAQLFRARSTQEARIAMAIRDYDLALVRTQLSWATTDRNAISRGVEPLMISTDTSDDPVLTILNNLRSKPYVHEPAYC